MPDEKKIPDVKAPDTKTPTPAKSETDKKSDAPKEGATASKKSDTPKKDTADSKVTSPAKPATDRKSDAPKKDATDPKVAPTKPTADKKADTAKKDTTDSKSTHPDKSDTDKPPVEEPIDPKKVQIPVGMTATVKVTSVPLSQLHRFEGHPFKVEDNGIWWKASSSLASWSPPSPFPARRAALRVCPVTAVCACQLAGLTSMPVIVRNLDRDEATINMVDANLKRENISPMEKARAYKMKLEAMKR